MTKVANLLPPNWEKFFDPRFRRIAVGYDVATTAGGKSNPASIAILQEVNGIFYARLWFLFKTKDPEVVFELFKIISSGLATRGLKISKLCVDATSERFFATLLKRKLAKIKIPTTLVVSSETAMFHGEKMNYKAYLGNLLCNDFQDGKIAICPDAWAKDNIRQVYRTKGTFAADVDTNGNHADGFDSLKLARLAISSSNSKAEADGARVGNAFGGGARENRTLNPLLKRQKRKGNLYV